MLKEKFKAKMKNILEDSGKGMRYVPYKDSEGNLLSAEEIYFTDEEGYKGKQTLAIWGGDEKRNDVYTVNSPGIKPVYGDLDNFPIAIISPEGKVMYLKVSAKTGEVLPVHAGCCSSIDIIYAGPSQAGKTVSILQLSDSAFHDSLARDTNCSFEDDLPVQSKARMRYEEAGDKLKQHILPEPTKKGEYIMPYVYYVSYTDEDGDERHILLRLQDIDGEQCVNMSWQSKIIPYNYFFLTIGADELIAGERGEPVQYVKVLNNLVPRLRVLRRDRDYEMVVIISKADLISRDNKYLKDAFENSVEVKEGKLMQTTHGKGFDYKAFNKRSKCIENYLMDECPNFYNKLKNAIPMQKLTFCLIANIGVTAKKDNSFEEYKPFCIDEPVLSVLTKKGMYPVARYDDGNKGDPVGGFFKDKSALNKKGFMKKILDGLSLDDDDMDEYDDADVDGSEGGMCYVER